MSGPAEDWTSTFAGVPLFQGAGAEPAGGFGGAQIGYNWEGIASPRLVLGVEADIQGAGISDSRNVEAAFVPFPIFGIPVTNQTNVDWFGTVRGRLGYTFGNALLYVTGGLAYGNVDNQVKVSGLGSVFKRDETEAGYAVGAGVEFKVSPAWSVKAEYQYIDFGSQSLAPVGILAACGTLCGTKEIDTNINTVRVGLNYHILPGYEPLK